MLTTRLTRCSGFFQSKVRVHSLFEVITNATFKPGTVATNPERQFHQFVKNRSKLFCQLKHRPVLENIQIKVINVPKKQNILNKDSPSCPFHSTPRRHIHPVVWVIVKPVAKIGVILLGRRARNKVPVLYVLFGAGFVSLILCSYYYYHIEYTPLTGRKRYKAFTSSQFRKISEAEAEMYIEKFRDQLLPVSHPAVIRVQNITTRLLHGNKELKEMVLNNDINSWTICVIDDPKLRNAFVLPSGHIFVFTGMLNFIDNDNQLAVVIGHEMSHAYLSHSAELMSNAQLLDMLIIVVMAALWTIIPYDGVALVTQWYYRKSIELMCRLPYSRKLEKEADYVGLQFAAKSCFDVREGSVFWSKMTQVEKLETQVTNEAKFVPEWLSTHPLSKKRVEFIDSLLPKALVLREECNCPRLPASDPREKIKILTNFVDNEVAIRKTGRNLSQLHHAHHPKPIPD